MADAFATLARDKFPDFLNVLQHVSLLGYGETADGPKLSPFHFGLSNGNGGSGMQRASWCAVKASEHLKASGSPHLPKFGLLQYMQHNEYALVNIAVHVTSREAPCSTCPRLASPFRPLRRLCTPAAWARLAVGAGKSASVVSLVW